MSHSRSAETLSAESLRWMMGLYCSFIGAFVLVAPHRFSSPPFHGLVPYQVAWGAAAFVSGVALLGVAILRPRRWVAVLAHGLAGLTLLLLALSFAQVGGWTGVLPYAVLGLGTAAAGLLPSGSNGAADSRHDLFGVAMALVGVLNGALLAGVPGLFRASYYDASRPLLGWLGLGLLLGSGSLLAEQVRRSASPPLLRAAHLLAGASFMAMGIVVAVPLRVWTGIVFYLGGGLALAFLPALSGRFSRVDRSALRTRLAFALATATSMALVLTAAVATSQEERLAAAQVLETKRIEAQSIARNIGDYVQLNGARAAIVASLAGRLPMDGATQRALLQASRPSYPDVSGFVTLDAGGRVLASTGIPLDLSDWGWLAFDLQRQERDQVQVRLAGPEDRLLILLSAPIRREDGRLAGVLVSAFPAERLARRIARPGSNIYLADGFGRRIAGSEGSETALAGLPEGWDRQVRQGLVPTPARRLAAFARVPGPDWVVAVEKPRSAALAGVRRGRDMAFVLLLLVVPLAVAGGIFAARRIARPLGTLADAVDELTAGNPRAPLDESEITEVARLSAAFREMRDRLAARTRESAELAEELRARAEALSESDRRKDEFLAMLAHELRNPLGAIANASYVLEHIGPADPPLQRSVAVIQRQIQHLVRLVDDLLDVSRITRGKIELRRELLDLRGVVRSAVEMTRPVVDSKEHQLEVALPAEALPVRADATRIEQVLGNLIRNAAKYSEPRSRIEISAAREGAESVVTVRDNGIGIPPELLPRIFDLFTQGEQSLDRSGGGLGIGLTLVKRLVEMHGGQVEARSGGPGQGSEFLVRLPLVQASDPS